MTHSRPSPRPTSRATRVPSTSSIAASHAADRVASREMAEVAVICMSEFDQVLEQTWLRFRNSAAEFSSPFFSPGFAEAVHDVRGDVKLALFAVNQRVVGLLPFHQIRGSAYPVGRILNDHHGILYEKPFSFDARDLLAAAGVRQFHFHGWTGPVHLPPALVESTLPSFSIELHPAGLSAPDLALTDPTTREQEPGRYRQWLTETRSTIRRQAQKTRRLARELGALSFCWDSQQRSDFNRAIELKKQQYQRLGIYDLTSRKWVTDLLHRLQANEAGPRLINSTLRFGDQTASTHLGLVEGQKLHYWLPAYDRRFAHGSPGVALCLESIDAAESRGLTTIDFGGKEQLFKTLVANCTGEVQAGCLLSRPRGMVAHMLSQYVTARIKRWPWQQQVRSACRKIFPGFGGSHSD